jgi:hypothetical protein
MLDEHSVLDRQNPVRDDLHRLRARPPDPEAWVDVGAWLLVLFLFAAAVRMHAFWKEEDETARQMEMAHFMKNMALAGAAIVFYVLYQWPELAI